MSSWKKLEEPGVYRDGRGRYRVIATAHNLEGIRRQRTKTLPSGATLSQAMKYRSELVREIEAEGVPPDQVEAPTVPTRSITHFAWSWADEMIREGRWRARTAGSNIQNLRDHILPTLGGIEVDDLQREDLREWVEYVEGLTKANGDRYGHATVQRWWRVLKHLGKALYLEGYADRRFVDWMESQPGPQGVRELRRESGTLTQEELLTYVDKARQVVPGRYAEIATLAFTGMRAGELYALDISDLDFSLGAISITKSYSRGVLGPTKSGRSRIVPMLPVVAEAIHEHRHRLLRRQNLGYRDGIVFPSDNGRRRTASALHKASKRVAKACGLDIAVGPQVLRSTYVTLLKQRGAGLEHVMGIVGHESVDSSDHYTRPRVEDLHRSAALILGVQEAKG